MNDILFKAVEQTKDMFIVCIFKSCHSCTILLFDLWMSKDRMNIFAMILNFLNDKWEPCHIIIGFFETINTSGNVMAL